MLEILIPGITDGWDEEKNEFVNTPNTLLLLEHSLISVHKWESKWHKPFLSKEPKTLDEQIDYIRCMTINKVPVDIYRCITQKELNEIDAYINNPMSATKVYSNNKENGNEVVTAEIIYSWMITLNIPVEFEKWHLEQLLVLIKVCSIQNAPKQNKNQREIADEYTRLNAMRKKQFKKG